MASKKKTSTIPKDLEVRHATASGHSYAGRYEFNMDSGQVVPRSDGTPAVMRNLHVQKEGNKLVAYVPALASCMQVARVGAQFSGGDTDEFANWNQVASDCDGKGDLRAAIRWWKKDPIVFRSVKVLSQLANSTFSIECDDEETKSIIELWASTAMSYSFKKAWFTEYFRTGMVPVFKTLIPYVPRDLKPGKIPKADDKGNINARVTATQALVDENAANAKEFRDAYQRYTQAAEQMKQGLCSLARLEIYQKAMAVAQARWLHGMIPGSYTVLDPECIEIKGPREMPWLREPWLSVSDDLYSAVQNPTPLQKDVIAQLPAEIVTQIRGGTKQIWLPPNLCRVCYGDKQPYERYPVPMCRHAFSALEMKYSLVEMDKATAQTVRNRILKVTIGNDQFPELDNSKLEQLARVFNTPGRNLTIFWNHTLSIQYVEPDLTALQQEGKYDTWNDEIRSAFGISRILTGTADKGGAIGNSVMNFKAVEEEVNEAQQCFLEWFHEELRMFKAALRISADARGSFDNLNLKDETKMMAALNQMVLNGLLDPQTALETLQYHFPTIMKRHQKFKKLRSQGLFMPLPSANNLGPGGAGQGSSKNGGGIPTGGKPAGQSMGDNNANKVGKSQPKNIKAKARMVPLDTGDAVLVIEGTEIDPQMMDDITNSFGIAKEWVMTSASFQEKYGREVDFQPEWPELSQVELMDCMRQVISINRDVDQEVQHAVANLKKAGKKAGGRGPYVTKSRMAELRTQAFAAQIDKHKPGDVDEKLWSSRLRLTRASLVAGQAVDPVDADALATVVLSRRYKKAVAHTQKG